MRPIIFLTSNILGNIRDILGTAMKNQTDFRRQLDAVSNYMLKFKVGKINRFSFFISINGFAHKDEKK